MEMRPGYKQTEIGVIPEDWGTETLESVCVPNGLVRGPFGGALKKSFFVKDGYKVYQQQNAIYRDPELGSYFINEGKFRELERFEVREGDFIVSCSGTIGSIFQIPRNAKAGIINQALLKITVDGKVIHDQFFFYVFDWDKFQQRIIDNTQGGAMQNLVGMEVFRNILLPLPPLPEQCAIAEVLSDADALIAALDRLIAKKRAIKQGAMQQLLTGQTRLPGFWKKQTIKKTEFGMVPEDWGIKPLRIVSSMNGRIGWQGLKQSEFTSNPDDPFLITGMNFEGGRINWGEVYHIPLKRYEEAVNIQLKPKDVLMTKDGTIGKLLYVEGIPYPGKASLNSHLLVFRPISNAYVPKFLFYQLSSKRFLDYVDLNKSGSTFFGITQEAVGNYNTYLPPLPEQRAIAAVLSDMDAEITALEARREKTRALKQGMMQELLTGRTRLT